MQLSGVTGVNGGVSGAFPAQPGQGAQGNRGGGFEQLMEEMVAKVSDLQNHADQSIQHLATGQSQGLHEVMLAVEKANVSFQLLTQVRNKAVEAYQEIMRMPV
jgi:flagellar hook-basal body complex protein FliE